MSDAPIKTFWDNERAMREIEYLCHQLTEKVILNNQLADFLGDTEHQLADSQKHVTLLLELANKCRIELVGQIHELADHIERARGCITDPDMLKQINGQRDYALMVSDKWNQNGNPFEALAATADLSGLILCHAEPIGWRLENDGVEYGITSYNREQADEYVAAGWNLKEIIYRAWEPK